MNKITVKRTDAIDKLVESWINGFGDYNRKDWKNFLMIGFKGYKDTDNKDLAEEYKSVMECEDDEYVNVDIEVVDDYKSWYTVYIGWSDRFDRDYDYGHVEAMNGAIALVLAHEQYDKALDRRESRTMYVKEGWK